MQKSCFALYIRVEQQLIFSFIVGLREDHVDGYAFEKETSGNFYCIVFADALYCFAHNVPGAEVCDATGDAICTNAGYQKKILLEATSLNIAGIYVFGKNILLRHFFCRVKQHRPCY